MWQTTEWLLCLFVMRLVRERTARRVDRAPVGIPRVCVNLLVGRFLGLRRIRSWKYLSWAGRVRVDRVVTVQDDLTRSEQMNHQGRIRSKV